MTDVDAFIRESNQSSGPNQSMVQGSRGSIANKSMTGSRGSFKLKTKVDPYALDFGKLRNQYVEDSSVKIPFVKSSFVHYSKCPRNMVINGREYKDLVITMEVVQAPQHLNYTQLSDPKAVREQEKARLIEEKKNAIKAEKMRKKQEAKAEKLALREKEKQKRMIAKQERKAEREAIKEEKKRAKEARKAERMASGSGSGSDDYGSDDEDEDEDEDESEEEDYDSEEEESEEDEEEDDEFDISDIDFSGLDSSEPESEESDPSSDYDSSAHSDEDREYTGNMFAEIKPIKFSAGKFQVQGQPNAKLGTEDYCCISIWSAGGKYMRYTRLKNTLLRVPPLETDQCFRVGHDAKRLYYIGDLDGKKTLVLIWLKDLSFKFIPLKDQHQHIQSLEYSSLFRNFLCYQVPEYYEQPVKGRLFYNYKKNFFVINLKDQAIEWNLNDIERLFFRGVNAAELDIVEFEERIIKLRKDDEPESDFEDTEYDFDADAKDDEDAAGSDDEHESNLRKWHKGFMVVKSNLEMKIEEPPKAKDDDDKDDKKDGDDKKDDEKKEPKRTLVKYFRAYYPNWKQQIDLKTKARMMYETSIEVKTPAQQSESAKKESEEVIVADDDDDEEKEKTPAKPKAIKFEENELIISSDNECQILALIIQGMKGEQHKVIMFNPTKKDPLSSTNRAGNCSLEFNMNSHIREYNQVFIVQTEPNDTVTAKQLNFNPEEDEGKLPAIQFTKPLRGYAKDCWLVKKDWDDEDEHPLIMTICKSSTDACLNADCLIILKRPEEAGEAWNTQLNSTKLKAQEIDLNYPCLVSNIGLNRMMIQSLTCPDQVASFKLDDLKMEFIAFAEYQNSADIGFKDDRPLDQVDIVPFSETGDKIAFLTRKFRKDEDDDDKLIGDMFLNILSIDSYSKPMKFELYTTNYEACMEEGMSDDSIQKCIVTQVTSARGLDVAFVAQYNDRIIYDCITSTKQCPIRFPLPANAKEKEVMDEDPDFNKDDCQFEQMAICRMGQVVRQSMIKDNDGAIYFMVKSANDTVRVLRTDPNAEMGGDGFIKTVFTLRSSVIYFMLFHQGQFYLMDEQKKVRLLQPNKETYMWKQINTLELPESDANKLVYTDYDEYTISDGVLHTNEHMFFLLESRAKDNPTWASIDVMQDNHMHISGPRYAQESGMIWYMQKMALLENDKSQAEEEDFFGQATAGSQFKGYSVIMQPLGDLSFLDLLPQRGENNCNYITFVNDSSILVNYSGRYLIFDLKGQFQGAVSFQGAEDGFRGDMVKLVNVSDSGKFFVFQGPRFLTKAEREKKKEKDKQKAKELKKQQKNAKQGGIVGQVGKQALNTVEKAKEAAKIAKKAEKMKSGGKKAPIFYIFKLKLNQKLSGDEWVFIPYKTELFPFVEENIAVSTSQKIDYKGKLSQSLIKTSKTVGEERIVELQVKNYTSQEIGRKKKAKVESGFFSFGSSEVDENPQSEEKYRLTFSNQVRFEKRQVLQGKIDAEQKRVNLGHGNPQNLARLKRRGGQMDRAWVFDNYIVVKCGSELQYIMRENTSIIGGYNTNTIHFELTPGAEVWIENVFSTGVEDLVQIFIIDDANSRFYVITWNLRNNREHSLFQSTYAVDVFPENLFLKGTAYLKQQDFNYVIDNGAVISLENNLPVQFFDIENEADVIPVGSLGHTGIMGGMKRLSMDRSRYLDMTAPGRVHHFISFVDLLYWERYGLLKEKHEISKGILTSFSPIARFPNGISVFHQFATNVKVLDTVRDAFVIAKQERSDDSRVNMLPLVFLHSNPMLNKPGKKTTPIHIALDKQSPIAFETMFQTLVDQLKVCVTAQLLDVLETIINTQSQSVLDFFESSFYITDQYSGLRALEWEDQTSDEKILATSCAYLTDQFMQSLVSTPNEEEEDEEENLDKSIVDKDAAEIDEHQEDAPHKYSIDVEPMTHVADDSNLKQVEAKILDFNWLFIGDNSNRLTKILSETDNDEIFACAQIRVFIDFMWQGYYDAIFVQLFLPFIFYFVSFIAYTGYFSHHEQDELSMQFICEMVCLVIFGKTYVTFLILEMIQIKNRGISYFFDVWNMIDIASLVMNATYVFGEVTNSISHENLQVYASIAIFMMWFKLFYWMRLFKPFSAFIRMITEIIMDIQVFLVMLIISLGAFANIIYVLNLNRLDSASPPIYDSVVGLAPADAVIHAYLTGLGDFTKDNYSEEDATVTWIMYIMATVIVQLIFMNLLIAIMGESFSRITANMQQSTLKELCSIMEDHIWLLKIDEMFADKRYILCITPDTSTSGGTAVERQIIQLKDQVRNMAEAQEQRLLRAISNLGEDVAQVKSSLDEFIKAKDEDESD